MISIGSPHCRSKLRKCERENLLLNLILIKMKKDYQGDTKVRQAVAVLPWGHNLVLMNNNLSAENITKST